MLKDQLLLLDLTVAYNLGAPMGHTLSSNAHRLAQTGNPLGLVAALVIDSGARWFGETNHCRKAYHNALKRIHLAQEKDRARSKMAYGPK